MAPTRSNLKRKVSSSSHLPVAACGSRTRGLREKRSTPSRPKRQLTERPYHLRYTSASCELLKLRVNSLRPRLFAPNLKVLSEISCARAGNWESMARGGSLALAISFLSRFAACGLGGRDLSDSTARRRN